CAGGAGGVVVHLADGLDEDSIRLLIQGAHVVLARTSPSTFVVVQHGGGGGGCARSLHLEAPRINTCVIDVPPNCPESADWIVQEALAANGFVEAHYDAAGVRRAPFLRKVESRKSK